MDNEKLMCPKCKAKRGNLDIRGIWARCWVCNHVFKQPQEMI